MQDLPRVTFLVITDACVIALLVLVLSGCVATPSRYRDRIGDFVTNMAATSDWDFTAPPGTTNTATAGARPASSDSQMPCFGLS